MPLSIEFVLLCYLLRQTCFGPVNSTQVFSVLLLLLSRSRFTNQQVASMRSYLKSGYFPYLKAVNLITDKCRLLTGAGLAWHERRGRASGSPSMLH